MPPASAPDATSSLQRLARYYTDVLTALAENSGRALRDLRVGRSYGLVADLSLYKLSAAQLLSSGSVSLDRITPDLRVEEARFSLEPEPYTDDPAGDWSDSGRLGPDISESHALIRIWRKQKQDTYNRETLLGLGLLRGLRSPKRQCFGPLVCYRVRPGYDPEKRRYTIEKISETPFPNLTLLAQLLTEDELSDIRPQLHELLCADDFDETRFERLIRIVSGAATSLRGLHFLSGRLHGLSESNRLPAESLPVLAVGAVLLNIPRGNAYLLDDLEKLASEGKDEDLAKTAVGPLLEVPADDSRDEPRSRRQPDALIELLFPFESNEQQREVAKLASHSRILVVHGPPGTGKSQTICNLVCHLVASGKTVLVTSQKDKALEVVRDKLPRINYLAMTLLRTDQESQKALLQALEYSQAAAGRESEDQLQRTKNFVAERLATNRRKTWELEARFSELRRLEHKHFATFERLGQLRNRGTPAPPKGSPSKLGPQTRQARNYISAWFQRAGNALETYRLATTARRINSRNRDDTNGISNQLRELAAQRRNLVVQLLSVQRRLHLRQAWQRPGTSFAIQLAKRLLSRKRKTASFEEIKKRIRFKELLSVFPCWILSIDDVARIFPLEPGLFDYLIVDEASQCNQATALHLAYRAKQMVVVGDEKQLPNASVQWLRAQIIEQLLTKNGLDVHPKKEFLSAHESLLGLALGSRDHEIHLTEHFRCDPKIIEWSNREFYGESLEVLTPLRSMRFSTPIEVRYVPGATEDVERRINIREAEAVANEVSRIMNDPKLKGLSLGVISPFQPQADYIYALLHQRFGDRWDECERRGLTTSTADGFQGDERDIVLYSLRHGPGSRPASIIGIEANKGDRRLNVAFTRARRKVILFTSMASGTFPGRFIRSFLDYAEAVRESLADPFSRVDWEEKFDSDFERAVCTRLRGRGLEVIPQFPVAGYRIDLAVRDKEGRRLGIECDGEFHYDQYGQLREEDYERQEILERAGWAIHRIPARRYYLDSDGEIEIAHRALSEQSTDQEISYLEFEDLAPQYADEEIEAEALSPPIHIPIPSVGEEPMPAVTERSQKPVGVAQTRSALPQPPFDEHSPWIEAARWARDFGHWTQANRVFLWEFGTNIKNGSRPADSDRERAATLWSSAIRQGFRPRPTGSEPLASA